METISKDILAREDNIASHVTSENSSTKSKLRKVYLLADEIMELASPHIACGRGCSSCCKMNVVISAAEADRIGENIGRQPTKIAATRISEKTAFSGVPCPFLKDDSCSIYKDRPLVCRMHSSFDDSAYWCDPNRMYAREMPMVEFQGLQTALGVIAHHKNVVVFADIRDFFDSRQA